MWEEQDRKGYNVSKKEGKGQVYNDSLYMEIKKYASNLNYKTFLEIGTWNGLGSTKAFSEGFTSRTDEYIFYSLECNKDKSEDAKKIYQNNNKMNILNEVIWNEQPSDFYQIFPECLNNKTFKKWNEIDILNMKQCNLFLKRENLPDIFDVIFLDGGEFTTYHEFQILKKRCKILILDDSNISKCKLISEEIKSNSFWEIIKESEERNGFLIAKNNRF